MTVPVSSNGSGSGISCRDSKDSRNTSIRLGSSSNHGGGDNGGGSVTAAATHFYYLY